MSAGMIRSLRRTHAKHARRADSARIVSMVVAWALLVLAPTHAAAGRLPRYGGDLRVKIAAVPAGLDPLGLSGDDGALVASLLYEGLARWGDADLEPSLARQWLREDEGRRWVFELRTDVVFHDGSRCDAQAVGEALLRLADPRLSARAWILSDLVGVDDYVSGRTTDLAGIQVAGADRIELRFAAPVLDLPARLALPAAGIARRHGEAWVGTGPFRLLSSAPGELRLAAFRDHRDGRPYLDHVEVVSRGEAERALYGTAAELVRVAAAESPPAGAQRVRAPAARLALALVQPQSSVLASEPLRQRLAAAFDRSVFVRAVLAGDGEGTTALFPGGPKIVPARPTEPPGDLATRPQRRARIVVSASEPVLRAVAERLQVHLFALGVGADLDVLGAESLAQALASRSYDVAVLGWTPPQPRATSLESATRARELVSSLLQPALGSALPRNWSAAELAGAKDPEAALTRDAWCIPLVFFHDLWQTNAPVSNLQPGRVIPNLGAAGAHLDSAAP